MLISLLIRNNRNFYNVSKRTHTWVGYKVYHHYDFNIANIMNFLFLFLFVFQSICYFKRRAVLRITTHIFKINILMQSDFIALIIVV